MERNKGCTFTRDAAISSEDAARSGSTGPVCPAGAIPTKAATGPEGGADVQCGCGWREAYWALAKRTDETLRACDEARAQLVLSKAQARGLAEELASERRKADECPHCEERDRLRRALATQVVPVCVIGQGRVAFLDDPTISAAAQETATEERDEARIGRESAKDTARQMAEVVASERERRVRAEAELAERARSYASERERRVRTEAELADANERIGELEAARDANYDAWQRAEDRIAENRTAWAKEVRERTEERDVARAQLAATCDQLAKARGELASSTEDRDALRAERDEARADLAQTGRALVGRTKERDEARAELAQLKKQHAELMRFEWESREDSEAARRELSEARARLAQMAEELASARERLVTIGEQRDEARDEATKWALSAAEETKRRVEERDRLRDELEAVKQGWQTELARLTGERDQLCRRTEELADALTRAEEERDQARDDEDRAAARAERYEDQREDMRAERNQALAERDEARVLFEQAIARGDALSDALRHALALRGTP